jgi:hypothetical protein
VGRVPGSFTSVDHEEANMLRSCRFGVVVALASLFVAAASSANLPTRSLALSGQEAPGYGQFNTFRNSANVAINNHGQVAFYGRDESDGNYWLADTNGALVPLSRVGHNWDPIFWFLNESGQTLVSAGCCNDNSVWIAQPGGPRLIASQTALPPGVTGNITGVRGLHINDSGQVIVLFEQNLTSQGPLLAGPPDALQMVGIGSLEDAKLDNSGNIAFLGSRNGDYGLWFGPPSNPQRIATDDSSFRLSDPSLSKNGHIAFIAPTGAVDRPGVFAGSPGFTPTLILRNGDPAPTLPGEQIGIPIGARTNDAGDVAFAADAGSRGRAFWAGHPGAIRPVILPGAPAPADVPGLIFTDVFGYPMLNGNGQVLSYVRYLNSLTSEAGYGLWVTDRDGGLHLVAREHGQLEFDDQLRTISQLGIRFGLNDSGQIAFTAQFTDGSSGLFLASVPEPASLLALFPIFFLQRRRR